MSSRPVTQQLLTVLRRVLPGGSVYPNGSIFVDDDYYRAGPDFTVGELHGGVDFFYANAALNAVNEGHPNVYAPVAGTLLALSPLEGGVGSVFIRDSNGFVHSILHLFSRDDTVLSALVNVENGITAGTFLGTMGGRGVSGPDQFGRHVHYAVYLPSFVRGDVSTWNAIDPAAYYTPGVNPDASGPNATGLTVLVTQIYDHNDNGAINTDAPVSESGGFVREEQSSFLRVGVNTPHTQPIVLRLRFNEAPDSLEIAETTFVMWNASERTAYITLPPTVDQSLPSSFMQVELRGLSDTNSNNEHLTYSIEAGHGTGSSWTSYNTISTVFTSVQNQSLFVLDSTDPTPAFDPDTANLPEPETWEETTLRNGTAQNNNASITGVGAGHPDFIDRNADGANDNGPIQGTGDAQKIHGGEGNDDVYGNGGGDALYGDEGDDKLYAFNINASDFSPAYLNGGSGSDDLHGAYGNDHLVGGSEVSTGVSDNDILDGRAGDDILKGGVGRDILIGGEGNDYLNGGPTEDPGIPDAATTGEGDALQGGEGDDTLLGGFGNDVLFGGDGHDVLKGGKGNDHLRGAATSRALNRQWTATDPGNTSGQVTFVNFSDNPNDPTDLSPIFGSPDFVDDGDALFGEDGHDMLVGGAGGDYLDGGDGNDGLLGNIGNDVLHGGTGVDVLTGHEGDDRLFGGADNDFLFGDGTIIEYTHQEDEPETGRDVLDGGTGTDELRGGGGNDTYIFARGYGQDTIWEEGGADVIRFGAGILPSQVRLPNNPLAGDLVFELGSDRLTVKSSFGANLAVEYVQFEDGTIWDLPTLSRLSGLGTTSDDILRVADLDAYQQSQASGTSAITTSFAQQAQVSATTVSFTLFGADGNDTLLGSELNDNLYGGADNDLIDGAAGTDTMVGGLGNDTYVVDDSAVFDGVGDVVFENANAGIDTVLSSVSYHMIDNVENLTLTGTAKIDGVGNALANVIRGNDANNTLFGHAGNPNAADGDDQLFGEGGDDVLEGGVGNDRLEGGQGNDNLRGHIGNDILVGGAGDDSLFGHAGNDRLEGGAGTNRLSGSNGSDVYVFGRDSGYDAIFESDTEALGVNTDTIELAPGILPQDVSFYRDGSDLLLALDQGPVQCRISNYYADTSWTNPPNPNYYKIERIVFNDGTIWDQAAIESRVPATAVNTFTGTNVNNTFIVDNALDTVVEQAGGGVDTIQSSVTYALAANVENLTLTGYFHLNATGNELGNVIVGNAGSNNLNPGSGGNDTLRGGAGDDFYNLVGYNGTATLVENAGDGIDWVTTGRSIVLSDNIENVRFGGSTFPIGGVVFVGNDLDNTLIGAMNVGNDLVGGAGADTLIGGDSNDTYWVDNPGDIVSEGGPFLDGNDTVKSTISYTLGARIENLILLDGDAIDATGNSSNNTLTGNAAANVLDGGAGNDAMMGAAGNDTYVVDSSADTVTENAGEGIDTVLSSISYTLGNNVENLTLTGVAVDGFGNGLNNTLSGNSANNTLAGGAGNDTYLVARGSAQDILTDTGGSDTVAFGDGITTSGLTVTRVNDNLRIDTGAGDILTITNWYLGSRIELFTFAGEPSLTWAQMESRIGASPPTNNPPTLAVPITDQAATEDGTFSFQVPANTFADPDTGDVLTYTATLSDGSALPEWLVFNPATQTFSGTPVNGDVGALDVRVTATDAAGLPVFDDFTLTVANVNDAPMVSTAILDQTAQEGSLFTFQVSTTAFSDIDAGDTLTYTATLDDASALPSWLSFDASTRTFSGTPGIPNVGNLQVNVIARDAANADVSDSFQLTVTTTAILGTNNAETLNGTTGDDRLYGLAGNDTLNGNTGNDLLDGGTGNDQLRGNAGDDTYIVDSTLDVVTESSTQGTDTVQSSVTYTLSTNVENLTLTGTTNINATGNTLANTLTGNSGDNTLNGSSGNDTLIGNAGNDRLDGGTGNDTMAGGSGDDTYIVNAAADITTELADEGTDTIQSAVTRILGDNLENLTLTGTSNRNGSGNALNNTITGNSGNNILNGGLGADTLIGGAGNDTYVIDNAADTATENANAGTDLVQSTISYTLGNNIENLTLTGTALTNATGNTLNNILTGNSVSNTLIGDAGNDTLVGNAGNDRLEGGTGNDILNGGTGNDTMAGGSDNDTYVVNAAGDITTELSNEGTDTVQSSVTRTLTDHLENLTLTGTSNRNGTGNALNNLITGNSGINTLTGNAGNDTLEGLAGNDILNGGAGNDTYLFGLSHGQDTITDTDATVGNTDIANLWTDKLNTVFAQSGNNLLITRHGGTERVSITNWYTATSNQIEQIKSTDAQTLLNTQVANLIQAMATFGANNGGITWDQAIDTRPDEVQAVISAHWQVG